MPADTEHAPGLVPVNTLDDFLSERGLEGPAGTGLPLFGEVAMICVLEGPDRRKYVARAASLSHTGLLLFLDKRLPLGVWTKVELECGIVLGEVSSATPDSDGGFRTFVRIDTFLTRSIPVRIA